MSVPLNISSEEMAVGKDNHEDLGIIPEEQTESIGSIVAFNEVRMKSLNRDKQSHNNLLGKFLYLKLL